MALSRVWFAVCVLVEICGTYFSSSTPSRDLIFGLVGEKWSSLAKSGIDDALNEVNNKSDLLSGYKLKYFSYAPASGQSAVTESQVTLPSSYNYLIDFTICLLQNECSRGAALTELFGQMFNCSHQIMALIDLGCSRSVEATAEISQYYNIIQVLVFRVYNNTLGVARSV